MQLIVLADGTKSLCFSFSELNSRILAVCYVALMQVLATSHFGHRALVVASQSCGSQNADPLAMSILAMFNKSIHHCNGTHDRKHSLGKSLLAKSSPIYEVAFICILIYQLTN